METLKDKWKKQISEILVKWDMPTRQVAINEIVGLFTEYQKELELEHQKAY